MIDIVPNSHFFTDVQHIINYIEDYVTPVPEGVIDCRHHDKPLHEELIMELKNTIKNGYNLENKQNQKIFILTQQLLNGTVTMDIWTKGIIADNFEDAVKKLKESSLERIIIHHDDSESFHFSVPQNEGTPFEVYGILNNKPLEII